MSTEVIHTEAFAEDAAGMILKAAREAIGERGIFRVSLSGGRTPAAVYRKWGETAGDLPWEKVQVTFGDERCVPPDHEESNYRMARTTLLDHVPIPEGNVFRMRGEAAPEDAAAEYEGKLGQVAGRFGEERYRHDLLLLGIGPDGHTASLFPGTEALKEGMRNVVSNYVPKFNTHRITFTYPLINAARHVCFMVEGEEKKGVIGEILAGTSEYPAGGVRPVDGAVTWLLGWAA